MISDPTRLIPASCRLRAYLDAPNYVLSILAAAQVSQYS